MRILIIVLVILLSVNLAALAQMRSSANFSTKVRENNPNKISVMERDEPFTKAISTTHKIKPGEKLNIQNLNGSIKFVGWNKNYIKITAIKKTFRKCCDLSKIHMVLSTLKGLNIKTVNISDDVRARIDYVINIPRNTSIGDILSQEDVKFRNLPHSVISNTRIKSNR